MSNLILLGALFMFSASANAQMGAFIKCDETKLNQRIALYKKIVQEASERHNELMYENGCVEKAGKKKEIPCDHIWQTKELERYFRDYDSTVEYLAVENQQYGCPRDYVEKALKK